MESGARGYWGGTAAYGVQPTMLRGVAFGFVLTCGF